uniref:Uncharacterized protein n=1 Tax=Molossus molossus TaxID=27622 RepID=A0A7J8DPN2_MOLMO|nr:hypothetical protein HJG59_009226 [Molossus molossus]
MSVFVPYSHPRNGDGDLQDSCTEGPWWPLGLRSLPAQPFQNQSRLVLPLPGSPAPATAGCGSTIPRHPRGPGPQLVTSVLGFSVYAEAPSEIPGPSVTYTRARIWEDHTLILISAAWLGYGSDGLWGVVGTGFHLGRMESSGDRGW